MMCWSKDWKSLAGNIAQKLNGGISCRQHLVGAGKLKALQRHPAV